MSSTWSKMVHLFLFMFLYPVGIQIATNNKRWVVKALDSGTGNFVHMLQEIAKEYMKKRDMVTVIITCYFMGAFGGNNGERWERLTGCEPEW